NGGVFLPPWGKIEQWLISVQHDEAGIDRFVDNFARFAAAVGSRREAGPRASPPGRALVTGRRPGRRSGHGTGRRAGCPRWTAMPLRRYGPPLPGGSCLVPVAGVRVLTERSVSALGSAWRREHGPSGSNVTPGTV